MSYPINERQALIAERIRQTGFQKVSSLAEFFNVTTQTIRRDISVLNDLGIVKRRHGGVEPPSPNGNLSYGERQILNMEPKEAIAAAVAARIPDGASLSVSIGTTPELCVRALSHHRKLTIRTNNLMAAISACTIQDVDVRIPGGAVRPNARDIVSMEAASFFERYKTDIGLYGVGGVDASGELLDFHEDEVAIREAIRANSRSVFLVLDSTKFGRTAHVRGGHITQADVIFCDREPPADIRDALQATAREIVICDQGALQ